MKIRLTYISLITVIAIVSSCKKDNVDAPSIPVTGRLVYNGEPIGVEHNQVPFQLYQYGFGKVGPMDGTFTQEGNFSALLFSGQYKFIIPNGQGPFLWKKTAAGNPDTLAIDVAGAQQVDIPVTPYYMIRNPQISLSGGTAIAATFRAEKIITDANARNIQEAVLYINRTQFVSQENNIAKTGAAVADPNSISLTVTLPVPAPAQNYVFARVGLRIAGVEDMLLSPVVKINL